MLSITPPTRHQMEKNVCEACSKSWEECKCNNDIRTDSIASLFENNELFPDTTRRHTCVHVYHSYQRWSVKDGQGREEFSLACLPLWEGWYSAWVKPEIDLPESVSWSEYPVLKCTLRYYNGTVLDGYIDNDGKLFLSVPSVRPPYGKGFDEDRGLLRMVVGVSQTLTIEEIRTCSRGIVYGGRNQPNSWRRVSHIMKGDDETATLRLLTEREGVQGKEVMMVMEKVRQYVPHLVEELKWRGRRRFRRGVAKAVLKYMYALVERARLNDEAVRFAIGRCWLKGLVMPDRLIGEVVKEVDALSGGLGSEYEEG